jgi:AraC-like DNA-binding protein
MASASERCSRSHCNFSVNAEPASGFIVSCNGSALISLMVTLYPRFLFSHRLVQPRSLLSAASTPGAEVIAELASYVAECYASPLRMEDLARHCHVSVRTLQNLCHAHCGEAPLKALRRFRLQKLHAQLLSHPWTSLRQHYHNCGLTGSLADRDLFFEMYGSTVAEHRDACRYKSSSYAVSSPLVRSA